MNRIKNILCGFSLIMLGIPLLSYATHDACPFDSVHCAYMSGLNNNEGGRFIKLSNKHIGSLVVCLNATSVAFIDDVSAAKYIGNNDDTYAICKDPLGKDCTLIGIDQFIITNQKHQFIATPKYFNIDVSQLKNSYPTCDSFEKMYNL